MDTNKTAALIEELESGLCAQKPLAHPLRRILPWAGLVFLYMAGMAFLVTGFRDDLGEKVQNPLFLFETGLTLMIALTAAIASFWLCVPDMRGRTWLLSVPVTLTAVFVFLYALMLMAGSDDYTFRAGFAKCAGDGLLFGAVPALALVFLSRKGATTRPYWMAFMNMLSVGALGLTVLRFTCGGDAPLHIAVYHFLPFIVLGILLGTVARRVYDW